jgi:hypothetical protein
MSNPYPASQLQTGAFAWGLADVITLRFLSPGEAFITPRNDTGVDRFGNAVEQINYHWYFFHQSRPVCTEEWVHPCTPNAQYDFGCQ